MIQLRGFRIGAGAKISAVFGSALVIEGRGTMSHRHFHGDEG